MRFAGCSLPEDYLGFLRFRNGFLDLVPVEEVIADSLIFQQHAPGGLVIGSDGGEGVLALDLRGDASTVFYAYMRDERHEWDHVDSRWADFKAMFLQMAPSKFR